MSDYLVLTATAVGITSGFYALRVLWDAEGVIERLRLELHELYGQHQSVIADKQELEAEKARMQDDYNRVSGEYQAALAEIRELRDLVRMAP